MMTRQLSRLNPKRTVGPPYLFFEMISRMHEKTWHVNLTDGAHVEGLGLYELIRRRCRFVIVTDATWDDAHHFAALANAIRLVRIDMGIHIRLDVDQIKASGDGVRAALGKIDYGDGQFGTILFLKSSLSGNENPYVQSYKAKNDDFPHESTGDQFFDETQFEAYRALGYHITDGALGGTDNVQFYNSEKPRKLPRAPVRPDRFLSWLTRLDTALATRPRPTRSKSK